jgi:hypothetical protein
MNFIIKLIISVLFIWGYYEFTHSKPKVSLPTQQKPQIVNWQTPTSSSPSSSSSSITLDITPHSHTNTDKWVAGPRTMTYEDRREHLKEVHGIYP